MKTPRVSILAACALGLAGLAGCGDTTTSGTKNAADAEIRPPQPDAALVDAFLPEPDADTPPEADATEPDPSVDAEVTPNVDAAGPAPKPDADLPVVGWVEVTLDPRSPLYGPEQTPQADAEVFDRSGHPVAGLPLTWRVEPEAAGDVDATGRVTFLREGPGAVVACTADDVCGRAFFHVDAGLPKLTVTQPERGAALGGDRTQTIAVRGVATDTGGTIAVRINGVPVAVDGTGNFALDVDARFGVNHLEVTAGDGVQPGEVRVTRDVLWAPRYLRVGDTQADVPDAARLWLGQSLLDLDAPVVVPEVEGPWALSDLSSLLAGLLGAADANALLGNVDAGGLQIQRVTLGVPEVDLYVVPEGLELFLRLGGLHLDVAGQFAFEGAALDLTGGLDASLAAFAHLTFDIAPDGSLAIEVDQSGVVLESLQGTFRDAGAQALIDTLGSRLRGTVEGLAAGLVDGIIREQLPTLVRTGLDGLIGSLGDIPIRLDVGLEGAPVTELGLALLPEDVIRHRRTGLALALAARLTHPMPVQAPNPAVPGIPGLSEGEPPAGTDVALGLSVRLELLNGLLHEVWRTGLLQISPGLPPEIGALLQSVRLDARLPPVVAPAAPGAEFPLDAQLGDVRVFLTGPAGGEPDEYVLTLTAGISLEMDETGALRLVSADMPVIQAELLRAAGARPVLAADALEAIFGAVVWPKVRDALAGGLSLSIPAVDVDPGQIAAVAPRIQGLTLKPALGERSAVFEGWMLLEGSLESVLTLGP